MRNRPDKMTQEQRETARAIAGSCNMTTDCIEERRAFNSCPPCVLTLQIHVALEAATAASRARAEVAVRVGAKLAWSEGVDCEMAHPDGRRIINAATSAAMAKWDGGEV